jgi:hypothetical protein
MSELLLAVRPLVAVVHLPPSLGYPTCPGIQVALATLERDLQTLARAGVDGVLLENDADKPHSLTVSKAAVAWLTRLATAARAWLPLPLGIGVQRIDWQAALAVATAASLDFVRLDVFVDRVRMNDELVEVSPAEVRAFRASLGADRVQLWTDVHVKHADRVDATSVAESARRARDEGADAVLVTGTRTGEPPSLEDLSAARALARPVLVGSGLSSDNAADLAAHADGALVGTALKRGARIDPERTAAVLRAWRAACR